MPPKLSTKEDPNAGKKNVMAELKEIIPEQIERDFNIKISPDAVFFNRTSFVVDTISTNTSNPPRKVRYEYYASSPAYKPYIALFTTGGIWGWPCAKAREAPDLFRNGKIKIRATLLPEGDMTEVHNPRIIKKGAAATTKTKMTEPGPTVTTRQKKPKISSDRAMTEAMLTPVKKDKILKSGKEEDGEGGSVSLMESLNYNRRLRKDGPFLEKIKTVDSAKKSTTGGGIAEGGRRRSRRLGANGDGKKSVYVEEDSDKEGGGEGVKPPPAKKARVGRGRPAKITTATAPAKPPTAATNSKAVGKDAAPPVATPTAPAARNRQQRGGLDAPNPEMAAAQVPLAGEERPHARLMLIEDDDDPQMLAADDIGAQIIAQALASHAEGEDAYNAFLALLDEEEARIDEEIAYIAHIKPILEERVREERAEAAAEAEKRK